MHLSKDEFVIYRFIASIGRLADTKILCFCERFRPLPYIERGQYETNCGRVNVLGLGKIETMLAHLFVEYQALPLLRRPANITIQFIKAEMSACCSASAPMYACSKE
jgi:hypothetical protein